jgi:hypothetical protein
MKWNREEFKNRMKNVQVVWLAPLFVIALELLFHLDIYGEWDEYMLYSMIFSLPFSALVLLLSSTKNHKWNVVSRCIMLFLVTIYYMVQLIYHQVFGNFLSLKSIFNGAEQALDFGATIWEAFLMHIVTIGVALALWVCYTVLELWYLKKKLPEKAFKYNRKQILVYLAIIFLIPSIGTMCLMFQGT